jgi:SAM-dependent methyltransferase
MPCAPPAALLDAASAPYRSAGRLAYHFARGKLRGDPAFTAILARGLLANSTRILDLGCGRGLLAAWLLAARACCERGGWPRGWPNAPQPHWICGIERVPHDIKCAQLALGRRAEFRLGDIRDADFETADAVVLLDVLHYIDFTAQEQVLTRVRVALEPHGVLLLRVGDAAHALRSRLANVVDHAVLIARGCGPARLYCRTLADWQNLLTRIGFRSQTLPMSDGTLFCNALLIAQPL